MHIAVLFSGVIRPTCEQVHSNLQNTTNYLRGLGHSVDTYCITYSGDDSKKLNSMLAGSGVNFFDMPPIINAPGNSNGNQFRMMLSNETLLVNIENLPTCECFMRMRIDCELLDVELPNVIEEDVYYAPKTMWGNGLFDNFGFCTPNLYRKIWNTNNINYNSLNPEEMLEQKISNVGAKCKPCNFHLKLFQSEDPVFAGVPQWSKKNRTFEYKDAWIRIE